MLCAVRGAITVPEDKPEAIRVAVHALVETLLERNAIAMDTMVTVFFTITPDLQSLNPATALREVTDKWQSVPLLCSQEPVIQGMLPRCLRILIQWNAPSRPEAITPVYLGEARLLRPDL